MAKFGSKADAKHKNAADALHESEDRFRVQADDVPVLIWGNGPDGCNFVNRAYLEFLGVSGQADVRHFDWARYIHPDDREAYLNEYLDCFERRVTFSAVFRFRRYDGVYCWMKSVGHPRFTPAGVFHGYVGSTQDITVQKAMEDELRKARDTLEKTVEQQTAELRESKESYRALVETSPDAIIVHKDGRFLYANQAALRLHGVDTLEQLQRRSIIETIHPDDRELIAARMEQMAKGAIAPLKEARLIRPDGQVVYFESTGTQINYGGDTALQVIVRDITERKQAEDSLRNNEKFLKNVFNCVQDGVSVLSKDLSVIRYNPTIEKWHGKDLIGKKCYRLFHGRDEPCETCPSVRAVREKTMQHEIVHDLIGWKEIYAYPLVDEDGNVTGTIEQVRDITERQRTEEALRTSEEKYRYLVENANSIIIRWDIKGNLTFFNEFAERLFGYSKNEIIGRNVVGTIVPRSESTGRDLAALMEAVERCPERYELNVNENICKDGRRVWITWTNKAIRDVDGNLIEILSVGNDVTERRRTEEELSKNLSVLAKSQEIGHLGSWSLDFDIERYEASDEQYRIFGFVPRAVEPTQDLVWKMIHPDDRERYREYYEAVRQEGRLGGIECRVVWLDSSIHYVHILTDSVVRSPDGRVKRASGITQDITERKRAEDALVREKYILTKSQEIAHVGNWVYDQQADEFTGSTENDRIYGYVPGKDKATRDWVLSRVLPEDRAKLADFMEARAKDGKRGSIDYRIVASDGSVMDVNSIVDKTVYDKAGRVQQVYGISQDVTERKRVEGELIAAKQQAELYLDLMGHDINNMHQIAMGYLELAKGMTPDDRQKEFIEKPIEVLQRSAQLIKNVRKLQKMQDGVLPNCTADVCTILAELKREFGSVPGKTITLRVDNCGDCYVFANELLHDVFANLVSNAIKHTGDRADISIGLDIIEDKGGRCCRVIVEDDGPGIPDEMKDHVFNRMHKGSARGMGLGLYLVKSLVESYGGRVWVEDRVRGDHSKGARFVVMLPAIE